MKPSSALAFARIASGLAVMVIASALVVVAQTQPELAQALLHGTLTQREAALAQIKKIPPESRSAGLTKAIIAELARMNGEVERRRQAALRGVANGSEDDIGGYYGNLIDVAATAVDASVIPVLVGAIDTGNIAAGALAKHGELALPAVIGIVRGSGDAPRVSAGIRTLQLMHHSPNISSAARNRLTEAVMERLHGRQHEIVWMAALDFAGASRNATAITILEAIATNGLSETDVEGDGDAAARVQRKALRVKANVK
jgi:hypothetical protein